MRLMVTDDQLKIIKDVLNQMVPHKRIYAFGSRVTGHPKPFSDLDLMCDDFLTPVESTKLKMMFDESDLPYRVDIVERPLIDDSQLEKFLVFGS